MAISRAASIWPQLPPSIPTVIAPESIDMVEGGVKSTLFDHRLDLDAAVFFENDTNYQANLVKYLDPEAVLANIPKVQSQGVEVSFHAQPVAGLSLYGSTIYDRAIYAEYPNAPCGLENITQPFCNLNGAAPGRRAEMDDLDRRSIRAFGEFRRP